jgi:muramoyltetrapeptide carboxypeptidase
LRPGRTIGVVATAGAVEAEKLQHGVEALRAAGFVVELAPSLTQRKGYLAGSDEWRVKALEEFVVRPDIHAIFCARGGFGSIQLLPLLDLQRVRRNPKIFVGFSDVTVLLNWVSQECDLVTFHGPMVAMDIARGLSGRTHEFFWQTLLGGKKVWQVKVSQTVRTGVAEGELAGGCLSLLVTTLGTPYEIRTKDKILFLEDVGEKPYRIERMLTHFKMAGKFADIKAVILGTFTQCEGEGDRGVAEVIAEFFGNSPYPVLAGFPAGHGEENLLLPIGARMAVDGAAGIVSLLEAPVEL